jgi:hypothetical protein
MVVKNEEGQAFFEFLLLLPLMLGVVMLLVKVNTATQVAIVNQQYARSQMLFLAYNSPYYPELRLRRTQKENTELMILGVADNVGPDTADGSGFQPRATTQTITRPGAEIGNDDEKSEPEDRGRIRIRNNVAMCTHFDQPLGPATEVAFCRSPF